MVTLTQSVVPGSTFTGWDGAATTDVRSSWIAIALAIRVTTVSPLVLRKGISHLFGLAFMAGYTAQLIYLSYSQVGRWILGAFALYVAATYAWVLVRWFMGPTKLKDYGLDLVSRSVHAIEHASLAALENRFHGIVPIGAQTNWGQDAFEVVIARPPLSSKGRTLSAIRRVTEGAIERLVGGQTSLAFTDECGTSKLVGTVLVAPVVIGVVASVFVFGIPPAIAIVACVVLFHAMTPINRWLGRLAQRRYTVWPHFRSATVGEPTVAEMLPGNLVRVLVPVSVAL